MLMFAIGEWRDIFRSMASVKGNYAFVDAQNLIKGTVFADKSWKMDLRRFRIFLTEKYQVGTAYYFLGVREERLEKMYGFLKNVGFELVFREHDAKAMGKKKGNVDTDIVFSVMDDVFRRKVWGKIVLVSGDGDYKKMVSRLIIEKKFRAIMFPNKRWSSLYNKIDDKFKVRLYTPEVKRYLQLREK